MVALGNSTATKHTLLLSFLNSTVLSLMIRRQITVHQRSFNANDLRDFTDFFLLRMQKSGAEKLFNVPSLVGTAFGVFGAFYEPIHQCLSWFLLLMAAHPQLQEQIHEALDSVVGRERVPLLEDKPQLPLLEAAILETLRYRNVVNLNLFRIVSRDTKLSGYDIPKGTVIIHNMALHLHDPKFWKLPDTFDPKRFLTENGMSLRIPEQFVAFSLGKWTCVGEGLAMSVIFLYAGSILSKFRVLPPDGGVNLKIKFNYFNDPAHPYVKLRQRH